MPEHLKRNAVPLSEVFLKGTLVQNPVLVELVGICPVAAAAVSLRAGALLAAVSSLILIITQVAASAFLKKIVRWVRVAVYLLLGLAVVSPVIWLLEKNNADVRITVGIYLPLLAVNSLAALRCEKIAVRSSVKHSFWDAAAASAGYSAVLLAVGFIRELLGSGTVLEKPVGFIPEVSGLLMPFGGFLVLGFLAAALKAIVMRYYPKYAKAMNVEISSTAVTMKLKPESGGAGDEPPVDTADMQADGTPGKPEPDTAAEPANEEPFVSADTESTENLNAALSPPENGGAEPLPAEPEETETVAQAPPAEYSAESPPVLPDALPEDFIPAEIAELSGNPDEPAAAAEDIPGQPAPREEPAGRADKQGADILDVKLKQLFQYLDELEDKTLTENKE